MSENEKPQDLDKVSIPTPKQFRGNLKEIFDSETTFGSAKVARLELLEAAQDIIKEYIEKGCKIVFIHRRLHEAGYPGSRKELSEWLVEKGLWIKRELAEKSEENYENKDKNLNREEIKMAKSPASTESANEAKNQSTGSRIVFKVDNKTQSAVTPNISSTTSIKKENGDN